MDEQGKSPSEQHEDQRLHAQQLGLVCHDPSGFKSLDANDLHNQIQVVRALK